jgi:ATP-binding cassette subfamily B protein
LACLSSIVKYHGGATTQEKLRDESGTTLQGTSLLGLYQSAQKLGFEAKGYQADIENLKTIKLPVILHILKEGNLEHYVICYGYYNQKFVIGDPAWGVIEYREDELVAVWISKTMLWLKPGKNFKKEKAEVRSQIVWFKELVKDDIPVLMIAAFMGLVLSVLGLAVAIYTQKLIDQILPSKDSVLLFRSLAVFAMVLLARAFIGYIRGIFLVRQSKDMNVRMVSSFFNKLLFLPKSFFDSTPTGDMIGRLNDSQRIQRAVINLSSSVLIDVLIVISSLAYIFWLSTSTGVMSLLSIPAFTLLALKYNRKVIRHQQEVMQAYAITESKYIDTIQGIKVIKASNNEPMLSKAVLSVYEFFQERVYELGILGNKINVWAQIGSVLLIAGIIAWTSFLVLEGQLLLGQMMAIVTIVGSLISAVINTAMANIQFQEAKVAFMRMYEFSASEPEYSIIETTANSSSIDKLEIKSLNFRFPGKSLLLKNIFIEIRKGQIITIFGEIGCGKSTLISILQRFYSFASGQILVNDHNWSEISIHDWRSMLGVVSQQVKLFNGTILENICLEENPNIEEVVGFLQGNRVGAFY